MTGVVLGLALAAGVVSVWCSRYRVYRDEAKVYAVLAVLLLIAALLVWR